MSILGQIPDSIYFSRKELSNSDLSLIQESYSHYLEKHRKVVTDAMTFGRAFDQFLLRREEFFKNFVILPEDFNGRTNEGKNFKKEARAQGREIIDAGDYRDLAIMECSVLSHPIISNIIKNSENEGSFTGIIHGVEMRCKVDILNQGFLFDVKTCASAKKEDFRKDIANRNYHRQMAIYMEIIRQNLEGVKGAALIPVEKPTPSKFIPTNGGIDVFWMQERDLQQGMHEAGDIIERYKFHIENPKVYTGYLNIKLIKECLSKGLDFTAAIDTIALPTWKVQKDLD